MMDPGPERADIQAQIDRDDWTVKELADEAHLNATSDRIGGYYVLTRDHVAVHVGLGTWAIWFEKQRRKPDGGQWRTATEEWEDATVGQVLVSTVFLGLDHSLGFGGTRRIFETMVFIGRMTTEEVVLPEFGEMPARALHSRGHHAQHFLQNECWRWPTYQAAVTGHRDAVAKVRRCLDERWTSEQWQSETA
jgi:hypothetical protein